MDNNTTKLLLDLVQTARDDNFNLDVTLARFPELQGVDKKLLGDFVATARDTEYDMEKTFSLFPEITGETKEQTGEPGKQVTPTIFRGTPLAGEDPSTSSGEEGVEDTTSQEEEAKKKEEEDKKFEEYEEEFGRDMHGSVNALGGLTEQQKVDLFGENHLMQSEKWKLGVLNSKRESGEWDGVVGGGTTAQGEASASITIDQLEANWESERELLEETAGMTELERENIRGERELKAQEIMDKGITNVDPKFMDVDQPLTIVQKDDENIIGFYEDARDEITGDLLFPGLEVSNVGSGSGVRLNFVLPTGETIFIDFGDDTDSSVLRESLLGGAEGLSVAEQTAKFYKPITDKLDQVKDWYDQKDPVTGKTNREKANLGIFKYLGQRADRRQGEGAASKFDRDNFNDINSELSKAFYKIKIHRDIASATAEFGTDYLSTMSASIGMRFGAQYTGESASPIDIAKGLLQYGETYTLIDTRTGKAILTSPDAGDVQSYLWNNLDKDDLNLLTASASAGLNTQLEQQLTLERDFFNNQNQEIIRDEMLDSDEYKAEFKARLFEELGPTEAGKLMQLLESMTFTDTSGDAYMGNMPELIRAPGFGHASLKSLIKYLEGGEPDLIGDLSTSMINEEGLGYMNVSSPGNAVQDQYDLSSLQLENEEEVLELLKNYVNGTGIISDADFLNQRQNIAQQDTQDRYGILMMQRDRDGGYILNPNYEGEFNAMSLLAGIEEVKRGETYAQLVLQGGVGELQLGSQKFFSSVAPGVESEDEVVNYLDTSYDKLFAEYERAEAFLMDTQKEENDTLLKDIVDAGLGYETVNGQLVVIGLDEAKVNAFQTKWNNTQTAQLGLVDKYMSSLQETSLRYNEFNAMAQRLGTTLNKEFDFGDQMSDKFWDGWSELGLGVGSFLGSESAQARLKSQRKGDELSDAHLSFNAALENGLKARYTGYSFASQAANVTTAIVAGAALGPWSMYAMGGIFGMSAGGGRLVEMEMQDSLADQAQMQLDNATMLYKAGRMSFDDYVKHRVQLDLTIDQNRFTRNQVLAGMWSSALIEGTISSVCGTIPNARAAAQAIKNAGKEIGKGVFRKTGKAALDFAWHTGKEMGGEVFEETSILIANQLANAAITGEDFKIDNEELLETVVQAAMISGPMNGSSNLYNTVVTQYQSRDARNKWYGKGDYKGKGLKQELERNQAALQNPNLDDASRSIIVTRINDITAQFGTKAMGESEILASLGSAGDLQTMLQNNMVRSALHSKAGVDPRMSPDEQASRLKAYLETLEKTDPKEAKDFRAKLDSAQANIDGVYAKLEGKFNGDALSEGGVIGKMYGENGLEVARQMMKSNPEFASMSNKEKAIEVHNQMKENHYNQQMNSAKGNRQARQFVDMVVYGHADGQRKNKKGGERKRKTKKQQQAENDAYDFWITHNGTAKSAYAITVGVETMSNAQNILSKEQLGNLKIEEKGTVEEMVAYVTEDANGKNTLGLAGQLGGKDGVIAKIRDGRLKALISPDGTYIVQNKEMANQALREGDLLQSTAIMHEMSHGQDALSMTKQDFEDYATDLYETSKSDARLESISNGAIRMRTTGTLMEGSKLKLEDESRAYDPVNNPILPMDQQTQLAQDEYLKAYQDILKHNKAARKVAAKYGQGLGNLWRGMTGRNKGNYTFKSKGSGLNYMVNFLNAFENSEVSSSTKRKMDAMPMDPQSAEKAKAKASEAGKKAITKQQKDFSNEITEAFEEIQQKITDGTLEGGEFVGLASMFEPYVRGLVNKHSRRPGFKDLKEDIISRILYESQGTKQKGDKGPNLNRGVMGLMQSYNPDIGVPLAAYIYEQLNPRGREGRAKEIIDAMLPETFTKRLDAEEGTTDIVDDSAMPDDIDVVDEIKSTGVKIWERTGDAGLEIHSNIVADYLAGKIDAKGKNWKTLQTPQAVYDAVFEMMGIEPKPGNLTKGDIKNAQRWLDKHLGEFIAAVPKHHTTKMVKGKDGKLEVRPDKAIGIPNVILEVMFNKGTRKDNLTPWHRKTDILDSEVLGIFGITERNQPNLYKKESNTSSRIRSAAKIVADAMYNQGVRVGMDINGDPNSDIVAVSEGKGRALFSESTGLDTSVLDTYDRAYLVESIHTMDKIAAVSGGWGTVEFREAVAAAGIPQSIVNFAQWRAEAHDGQEGGFKKPLKKLAALKGEGKLSPEGKALLDVYLGTNTMKDGKMPAGVRKDTANGAIALIDMLSPQEVRALGKEFFGLTGSSRGLGTPNPYKTVKDNKGNPQQTPNKNFTNDAARVQEAFNKKIAQPDADIELGFNPAQYTVVQGRTGLLDKINKIKAMDMSKAEKDAKIEEELGEEIRAVNSTNKLFLNRLLEVGSTIPNNKHRVAFLRLMEIATNNGKGPRGMTGISGDMILGGTQATYMYTDNKGNTQYTNNKKIKNEAGDLRPNTDHPLHDPLKKYADAKAKADGLKKSPPMTKAEVDEHARDILVDMLIPKGEHMKPSANALAKGAEFLIDQWTEGGKGKTSTADASNGFDQTNFAKMFSELMDMAYGTNSNLGNLRITTLFGPSALPLSKWETFTNKNAKDGKSSRGLTKAEMQSVLDGLAPFVSMMIDPRTGQQIQAAIDSDLVLDEKIEEVKQNLIAIEKSNAPKRSELKETSSLLDKNSTDLEAEQVKKDSVKATHEKAKASETGETKGMTAWDFDDTLATTKSNVIFTKDGETKIVSAEDFAKEGADLIAEGWTPDFSEFNKVTGGKPGPMFEDAIKRAKKYGTEDTYILTARAPESAVAIKEFLDALGLDIPLENITGLGNSTGEAKARWLLNKHAEGYNDIAFADDAMQNVKAVQDVFNEFDIKGKVEQAKAKFSEQADVDFNDILDEGQQEIDLQFNVILGETMQVDPRKTFSAVKARQRGKNKGRFKFFLPPSAEDFKGLMYSFMGKGKQGERHHKWIKENLFDPYTTGIRRIDAVGQEVSNDLRSVKKAIPGIKGKLRQNVGDTNFNNDQAVRVYNWVKAGVEVPGLSQADQRALIRAVEGDVDLKTFAQEVANIATKTGVEMKADNAWLAGTVSSDLNGMIKDARSVHLSEWQSNVDVIFSEKNRNKIEAVYGTNFREALEDSLYRMRTGSTRPRGQSKIMNSWNNWINGSVGTTMFFNARSAALQMISNVNFVNWHDNNPLKAAKAFANQKQYWSDVAMIFNSDYLKQRRGGIGTDLNAAELLRDMKDSPNKMKTAIAKLLQIGFTPTQIADSLAIATGGATMYRNRIDTHMKAGMSKSEAEAKAFEEMQEIAEETQQSARPDKISQQQASPLGKLILAFQNTPMQYNRIMKRAAQDWVNGRGDPKEHASKIAFYGGVQSAIFYGLQTALWSSMFGDDDEDDIEKKQGRVLNGMMDSLLRGGGITGAVVSTAKNTILKFMEEDAKNDDGVFYTDPNHAYTIIEALNLSPPIGIKARKLYSSTQTWQFNRDVIDHMSKTDLDNPIYDATFSATEALTNVPLSRLYNKYQNISEAMNSDNETWQRVAMLMGWSKWSFGIKNQDVMTAKQEVKEIKAEEAEEKREQKKIEKEAERQAANEAVIQGHIDEQQQQRDDGVSEDKITCAAVKRNGERCGTAVLPGQTYCTVHEQVDQRSDGKKKQCTHVKASGDRCKMQTSNQSGKCYYHD